MIHVIFPCKLHGHYERTLIGKFAILPEHVLFVNEQKVLSQNVV